MPSEQIKDAIAEAQRAKIEAEAQKALAEAREADARVLESQKHLSIMESEQRSMELATQIQEIAAWKANRDYQDELAKNRYHHFYYFSSQVGQATTEACINQLSIWARQDPGCDIEIAFNSPGGSIVDGLALYDYIQSIRAAGHKVTTSTIGMAASMAGILLQAGDVRIMSRESWLLIHEAAFLAAGKIGEVEDCVPLDHPVLMADLSYRPAGNLQVGDRIIAFDEAAEGLATYRRWRIATVTSASHGLRSCLDVGLANGDVIRVSENHPWLGRGSQSVLRWRKASELRPGHDRVARIAPFETPQLGWEAGFVAGLLDADGTVSRIETTHGTANWRINFGQNAGPTFDRLTAILRADGFTVSSSASKQEPFMQANIYGLRQTIRLLQRYRPPRLLARFERLFEEAPPAMVKGIEYVDVEDVTDAGIQPVVLLATSTKTFVGQGYGMHNTVDWVKKISQRVLKIFASRSHMNVAQLDKNWKRRDWWIDSEEALKLGLIDEVR